MRENVDSGGLFAKAEQFYVEGLQKIYVLLSGHAGTSFQGKAKLADCTCAADFKHAAAKMKFLASALDELAA